MITVPELLSKLITQASNKPSAAYIKAGVHLATVAWTDENEVRVFTVTSYALIHFSRGAIVKVTYVHPSAGRVWTSPEYICKALEQIEKDIAHESN